MLVFITVGSTQFDPLVHQILQQPVLDALKAKGYTNVIVQSGDSSLARALASEPEPWRLHRFGVDIDIFRFKPTLEEEFRTADLVISHAGTLLHDLVDIAPGRYSSGVLRLRNYTRCLTAGGQGG
jgi:beta-1,4-N-acetylglucosaminyltransferase